MVIAKKRKGPYNLRLKHKHNTCKNTRMSNDKSQKKHKGKTLDGEEATWSPQEKFQINKKPFERRFELWSVRVMINLVL